MNEPNVNEPKETIHRKEAVDRWAEEVAWGLLGIELNHHYEDATEALLTQDALGPAEKGMPGYAGAESENQDLDCWNLIYTLYDATYQNVADTQRDLLSPEAKLHIDVNIHLEFLMAHTTGILVDLRDPNGSREDGEPAELPPRLIYYATEVYLPNLACRNRNDLEDLYDFILGGTIPTLGIGVEIGADHPTRVRVETLPIPKNHTSEGVADVGSVKVTVN